MKNRKTIIAASLATALAFGACGDDFLEVDSSSSLLLETYYDSEDRLFEAVVATYDPLAWYDYGWSQFTNLANVSEVMADDVYPGGSDESDCSYHHEIFNYTNTALTTLTDPWLVSYSGINRANNAIEHIGGVEGLSADKAALFEAEAKVLRSFYYTWLWKLWGNIPYYETSLSLPYLAPQYSADSVYARIVFHLEDAIDNGGLPMKAAVGDEGRVTKAMAIMLYTDAVMYQNDESRYNKALTYLKEIESSSEYALVSTEDLKKMWEKEGEWSSESIWEVNYNSQGGMRGWSNALAEGGSVYPKWIGINALEGSPEFEGGWGGEPVRTSAYQMYDAADVRRDVGILDINKHIVENPGVKYTGRYEDTGYFMRKYLPRKNGTAGQVADADMNWDNNWRVYRYAETLLYLAELLVRTGGDGQGYLDQVRTRAGLASIPATIDNIIQERHLELMGEGKRYWDLIRTGKAATVLTVANDEGGYRRNDWTENKKYLPIPQSEIDAAQGTLKQNNY